MSKKQQKKFCVGISTTLHEELYIRAKDEEEAIEIAEELYQNTAQVDDVWEVK